MVRLGRDLDPFRERLGNLHRALDAADRDPATLELTAGVYVRVSDDGNAPDDAMHGSSDEIASALAGYAELGMSHLIAHVWPRTPGAVTQFAEAATLARARLG